jgi:hypothetical protein
MLGARRTEGDYRVAHTSAAARRDMLGARRTEGSITWTSEREEN